MFLLNKTGTLKNKEWRFVKVSKKLTKQYRKSELTMITVACCMFDVTVSIYTNHVFCLLTCLPGYLSLYVVYVLTVIISAYIYNRQKYSVSADSLNEPQIPGQSYPKYKSLKKRIDKH